MVGDTTYPSWRAIDNLPVEVTLGMSTARLLTGSASVRPLWRRGLAGTWLLYLRRGDAVITRPSIARLGPITRREAEGLPAAVMIADTAVREAQLQHTASPRWPTAHWGHTRTSSGS